MTNLTGMRAWLANGIQTFAALLLGVHALPVSAGDGEVTIAIPGKYVSADKVESGGDWWGITSKGIDSTLTATTVSVSAIPAMYQAPGEEPRGVAVQVSEDRGFTALVRGSKHFRAGPLVTPVHHQEAWRFLYPGERRDLTLDKDPSANRFNVWATGTAIVPEGSPMVGFFDYKLIVTENRAAERRQQVLLSERDVSVYERPEVLWAGDLDREGRPDMIANRTEGESEISLLLFLSSAATNGESVGLAARWKALGPC